MSHLSASTDRDAVGLCANCRRPAVRAASTLDGDQQVVGETIAHVGDVWMDRACQPVFVPLSPVTLDDTRLAEVGDLIRYESSVTFHSHRAHESVAAMQVALKAVRALHHPIDVSNGEDYSTICAACGEDMDGGKPCTTLRALGQA